MYHLTVRKLEAIREALGLALADPEAITGYRDAESVRIEDAMRDALHWVHEQLEKREKKAASS